MRDEVAAAEVVEQLAPKILGRSLGRRTERDGRDGSGLRVDFTYDECAPSAALEITGIHAPQDRQLWGEIDKRLEPQLTRLAEEENLGSWLIVLDATANVRRLLAEVPGLMRAGVSFRPGEYTSNDLLAVPREKAAALVARHQHFQSLGSWSSSAKERWKTTSDAWHSVPEGRCRDLKSISRPLSLPTAGNSVRRVTVKSIWRSLCMTSGLRVWSRERASPRCRRKSITCGSYTPGRAFLGSPKSGLAVVEAPPGGRKFGLPRTPR